MGDAIKHCFANLTNFDGRDDRPTFWWWVLLIVIINFVLSFISGIVFTASSMGGVIEAAGSGADQAQIQAEMMQNMAGSLSTQAWIGVVITIISLGLLIATFVRRLRDAGLPVWIAVIPVVASLYGAYASVAIVDEVAEVMATGNVEAMNEFAMSGVGAGMVGWISYLVVIVCGLLPSKG